MVDDEDKPTDVKMLEPHQLGWLRRPELDTYTEDMWEKPDGQLHAQPKGKRLMLQFWKGL